MAPGSKRSIVGPIVTKGDANPVSVCTIPFRSVPTVPAGPEVPEGP